MAHKKGTMTQVIVSPQGEDIEVTTCKEGWNPRDVADEPLLLAGWAPGGGSHHSFSLGFILACKDKIKGFYLGDFPAKNAKGEDVKVPVFDPLVLHDEMEQVFCDKYGIDYSPIRAAANRSGAKKELASIREEANKMDDEVLALIKTKNPELYTKLTGKKIEE